MAKVRYGVVGAGWISQIAFMPSIAQTANSEMTAIVSGNAENAAKLADFYGIKHVYSYDQYDEMLASNIVDAVYVALPNSLHAEYAIRAARAGKHALVEKPLAVTVAECEAMVAAAAENNVWLMTAYRLHNEPGTVKALSAIREGKIGEPRIFSSVFSQQSDPDNHRLLAEHWGGPIQDLGVYCLNAARHVFGSEPVEVSALRGYGDGDPRFTEVEETFSATLRFPGDRLAQFTVSFGGAPMDMFRVVGADGVLIMDPAFSPFSEMSFKIVRDGEVTLEETSLPVDHFGGQSAYFSDCILNGVRPESDGEEGLADVAILRALEKAAETGRTQQITLPPRSRHPDQDTVREVPKTERRLVF